MRSPAEEVVAADPKDSAVRSGELLGELVSVVRALPDLVLEDLAARVAAAEDLGDDTRCASVLSGLQQAAPREAVARLLAAARAAGLGPSALAWALRAAHATEAAHRAEEKVELVWTGPAPHGSTLRRTDQVLLDLVRGANDRLLLVMFAAFHVPELHAELLAAANRGVRIQLVIETPEDSEGGLTVDPRRALSEELTRRCAVWLWPNEARARDELGRYGRLHAKCAVADGARLLVSSANFTGAALLLNMELGVSFEGGALPGRVERHFLALQQAGVLVAA